MRQAVQKVRMVLSPPRLGIEIESGSVRGVLVRRGQIVRTAIVRLAEVESLDVALARVLDSLRPASWRKPRVFVSIGAATSQLRRLVNLPAVEGERNLRAMVRSNAGRFFLKNGVPLLTSSVSREENGCGWAAALEEPPVRAAAEACRSSRLRLELAAPSIVALRRSLDDEWLTAVDGEVVMRAHVAPHGGIHELRRVTGASMPETESASAPVAALRALGDAAAFYAAPYGATTIDRREPLVVPGRDLRIWRDVSVPRWRLLLACSSLGVAIVLALLLPALYARRVAARTAQRLEAVNRQYRQAHWMESELARTTTSLSQIESFRGSRPSAIQVLADLTAALPPDAWLQSLHIDSQGGTITALAPRAAVAVGALTELRSITSPTIVGAVSSEQLGPDRIERVTVSFHWKTAERSSARSPARTDRGSR